jgi:hypothetical protein
VVSPPQQSWLPRWTDTVALPFLTRRAGVECGRKVNALLIRVAVAGVASHPDDALQTRRFPGVTSFR